MIAELGRELEAVGIRGRRRARILAEFADHLASDPDADLGDARELAQQFADDLGISATRRAALATFGALAFVACAVGVPELTLPRNPDIAAGRSLLLVGPATLAVVVGAQVAFAAGCLAALRALRRPRDVELVRRRTAVALAAGAAAATGSALYALNFWGVVPDWWAIAALTAAGLAMLVLTVAAALCARAGTVRVSQTERAAGLSADLGPLAHPALVGAGVTLLMLAGTGLAERSLVEGALRAAFESLAFTACFVALRRPLALTD
jgi:VIT1/CCC1 family predicted Fe2+/Mn2+ transporter